MNNSRFEHNLTNGSVFKQLIFFAIPFFISNLIQSAYSVADMIILGNFAGKFSISGVNTSSQVVIILTNLAAGISTGGTVMIGQYFGAGLRDKINKAISTLLMTLFGMGVVLTGVLLVFNEKLLGALNVPDGAYDEAQYYLIINLAGLVFVFGYNALSSIMRGLGDSKTPLIFVGVAGAMNVVLDLVFVAVLHWGAAGAAAATIISQAFSMFACIIYLTKNNFQFDFKPSSFKWNKEEFRTLMKVGLPTGVQHVCTNFSFLFLTAMINSAGGVEAGAASGIVNKFNSFAILPCVAVSSSVSAMISQSIGAGKRDRVKQTAFYGMRICVVVCAFVFAIANLFPEAVFKIFGSDKDTIEVGLDYIFAFSFEYVSLPVIVGFNSLFIGTGNGWISLITNMTSSFLIRIPMALLLGSVLGFGFIGIAFSIPIATLGGSLIALGFFLSGVWKKSRVVV